jgi:hypothetical protein
LFLETRNNAQIISDKRRNRSVSTGPVVGRVSFSFAIISIAFSSVVSTSSGVSTSSHPNTFVSFEGAEFNSITSVILISKLSGTSKFMIQSTQDFIFSQLIHSKLITVAE